MRHDAIISIRFLPAEEGGRSGPIEGERYGCPLLFEKQAFDCRFCCEVPFIFELGNRYEIPIKFLNRDKALAILAPGSRVALWEGKVIGVGEIVAIEPQANS